MSRSFLLVLLFSCNAHAGLFDSFKDPATLILNQKQCFIGGNAGEMINGDFIVNGVAVIFKLKKLDKNRVSFERMRNEDSAPFVANVKVMGSQINTFAPNGSVLIYCNLS
ncbi:hypothetical protein CL55_00008290 [Polynucleobacter duraquae]|jgi:hypothetical protein|uniref:Uncharacterized protein n=1 Tax=Polynucleobacter duraquae TaxID=1835254 RepID=A0A0E3ZJM3_9BURK|nr:hypothetical protein CL55_00008290 [Polynucleobacter duraquae]